jgi:hypothetical protein
VGVVIRGQVKDDRDQGPDVLNTSGLGVEVGDGGGLECFGGVREVENLQWSHEVPLDGGKLVLEGGHCSLLLLLHGGHDGPEKATRGGQGEWKPIKIP